MEQWRKRADLKTLKFQHKLKDKIRVFMQDNYKQIEHMDLIFV